MRPLLPLLLALAVAPALVACDGGPGPGGYPTGDYRDIQPQWSPRSQAQEQARASGGMLVALQSRKAPIGVWTDALKSQSQTFPFVRLEDAEATSFATRWKIPSLPAVAVCDQYGNVLDALPAPLTAAKITALLQRLPELKRATALGLRLNLQRANAAAAADKPGEALAALAKLAPFSGYPACAEAEQLRQSLLERGLQALGEAREKPASVARGELVALKREYQGTPVADEAGATLRSLK
jgi:hypothetical protein